MPPKPQIRLVNPPLPNSSDLFSSEIFAQVLSSFVSPFAFQRVRFEQQSSTQVNLLGKAEKVFVSKKVTTIWERG